MEQVEAIAHESFRAWEEPCCSVFRAHYGGRTDSSAREKDDEIALAWTDAWPSSLGDETTTIGVTMSEISGIGSAQCVFEKSGILFNNQGYRFPAHGSWDSVRLADVLVHEVGHMIGLGHSDRPGAIMLPTYQRSKTSALGQDDLKGLCALYPIANPASCECTLDSQCPAGGQCQDGRCAEPLDCDGGQLCAQGTCTFPRCQRDADCPAGLVCDGGQCGPTCPVCAPCQVDEDCAGAAFCAELADGNSRCMLPCDASAACSGNTACVGVELKDKKSHRVCLNADLAERGVCPGGFVCEAAPSPPAAGRCAGVGNTCAQDVTQCVGEGSVCLSDWQDAPTCTCTCERDADCGTQAECVRVTGLSSKICKPRDVPDLPCDSTLCAANEVCIDGRCVAWIPGTAGSAPPTPESMACGGQLGAPDAGPTSPQDTGVPDAGPPGPNQPDADQSDAHEQADAGLLTDPARPDAGNNQDGYWFYYRGEGCAGCAQSSSSLSPALLAWLLMGLGFVGMRRFVSRG